MAENALENRKSSKRTGLIARSTLIVMVGWGLSTIVGLIRQRVIAGQFGTGFEIDAFTAANVIPELIFTMLSGGALSFAFLPVYTELLQKDTKEDSNRLFSQVINWIFLLTGVVSIAAYFLAPILVTSSWGVGAQYSNEVQMLIIRLMRLLLLSTVIFSGSSILTSVLYAHNHFIIPALLPSLYSGGVLIGAVFLAPRFGIFGIAWGAIIGAAFHFLIQVPGVIYYKVKWHWIIRFDQQVKRVAILMAPRIIDLLMARASINWLNATLSSHLGEGRLAALDYAYRLMNMPWTLVGTAIGIAVFPTMAALAAQKDVSAQRKALSGSMRAILTLAIPAAVGLIVLGRPIIRILFEGGEFTPESTEMVFYALQFYTVALISQSMLEVVVRAFAAQQDTYTPLYVSIVTTMINIGLAIWLAKPIAEGGLAHAGPALANGIAVGIEALTGLTILSIRWKGVDAKHILLDAAKALISAGLMGALIWAMGNFLGLSDLKLFLLGGGAGAVLYFGAAYLLGIKEIKEIPLAMLRNLKKSSQET
jgi:putative peptidoglycan lipid II flippase